MGPGAEDRKRRLKQRRLSNLNYVTIKLAMGQLAKIFRKIQGKFRSVSRTHCTKIKVSIKDFFSKYDQIRRKLRIWSHLAQKPLMENLILCAVTLSNIYDKAFVKNGKRSLAVNYFHKKATS